MTNETSQEPGNHKALAIALFNRTWELLDKEPRTSEDDVEMLTAAFASRYHWRQIGDAKNFSVSDWQVARVAAVLGNPDLAETFGRSSLGIASTAALGPFYVGYAHEAMARAAQLAGNRDEAADHLAAAHEMLELIEEPGERDLLAPDLEELGA